MNVLKFDQEHFFSVKMKVIKSVFPHFEFLFPMSKSKRLKDLFFIFFLDQRSDLNRSILFKISHIFRKLGFFLEEQDQMNMVWHENIGYNFHFIFFIYKTQ